MRQKEMYKFYIRRMGRNFMTFLKWGIFSVIAGGTVGLVSTFFAYCLERVTDCREQNPWLLLLLPLGGLAIVFLYGFFHNNKDRGTNMVLSTIHAETELPFKMAPLIFVSTLVTHLLGGSAGREGAALQLGGSIGNQLGRWFRMDDMDKRIVVMCGMSAAFSAVFGTPIAASIFAMEVVSVGIMYYAALVPCVISALIAHGIAGYFGAEAEIFLLSQIPEFGVGSAVRISLLAALCALVSILFCILLHGSEYLYKRFLSNPYIRSFVGGAVVILLTLLVGDQRYNGSGIGLIEPSMEGEAAPEMFLLKMLFTAATLGAGFKGGEIVPSFCIGGTFGCVMGKLMGFSPSLCTAVGMTAVFCGVTNCPISSLLISFEMFGYEGMPYFLLTIAFSYMLSGYFGLYHSQKIMYSKFKTNYINKF